MATTEDHLKGIVQSLTEENLRLKSCLQVSEAKILRYRSEFMLVHQDRLEETLALQMYRNSSELPIAASSGIRHGQDRCNLVISLLRTLASRDTEIRKLRESVAEQIHNS